jgi:hypothetical protein
MASSPIPMLPCPDCPVNIPSRGIPAIRDGAYMATISKTTATIKRISHRHSLPSLPFVQKEKRQDEKGSHVKRSGQKDQKEHTPYFFTNINFTARKIRKRQSSAG